MRYPSFPGVAKRIRERLAALGWVDPKTRAVDIGGFIEAKHYDARSFYPWVNLSKGRTPAGKNLVRLCRDLKCSVAWLLHGEEGRAPMPLRTGTPAENPLPVGETSTLKEEHTKGGVSPRKDEILRKVPRKMAARRLPHPVSATARGSHRRIA